MKQWKKDMIFGLVLAVLSVVLLINSLQLDDGGVKFTMAQAGNYSAVWEGLLLLCSLLLIVGAFKKKRMDPDADSKTVIFHPLAIFTIVSLAIYVFALGYLGFIISTIIYLLAAMIVYTWKANKFKTESGEKKSKKQIVIQILVYVIVTVIITVATYYIFTKGVGIMMPGFELW